MTRGQDWDSIRISGSLSRLHGPEPLKRTSTISHRTGSFLKRWRQFHYELGHRDCVCCCRPQAIAIPCLIFGLSDTALVALSGAELFGARFGQHTGIEGLVGLLSMTRMMGANYTPRTRRTSGSHHLAATSLVLVWAFQFCIGYFAGLLNLALIAGPRNSPGWAPTRLHGLSGYVRYRRPSGTWALRLHSAHQSGY